MTAPQVRYCKTSDGISIAYTVSGTGPAILWMGEPLVSHAELAWTHPVFRLIFERLADRAMFIAYDPRGTGLSDRGVQALVPPYIDAVAVVEQVGLTSVDLVGVQTNAPSAIKFAAAFPEMVRHVVIIDGLLRLSDAFERPQIQALMAAATADFTLATELLGPAAFGIGREESKDYGVYCRMCVDPDYFEDLSRLDLSDLDASADAVEIKAPTLILRHAGLQYVTVEMAREVAATIPEARLTTVDGMWADDPIGLADRILDFVLERDDEGKLPVVTSGAGAQTGLTVILFADIADSTGLTERLGDSAFRDKARDLDAALRRIIRDKSGTPIEGKLLGDGVLATFASARQAIEAALTCGKAGDGRGLPLHLGLHAGDVISEEGNVYGGAVTIAARISDQTAPGEVLVSQTVRDLARTSAGVTFEDAGERELKGVSEPLRVWAVREAS